MYKFMIFPLIIILLILMILLEVGASQIANFGKKLSSSFNSYEKMTLKYPAPQFYKILIIFSLVHFI